MNDFDELADVVGSDIESSRVCPQQGCNKRCARMAEVIDTPQLVKTCSHCFRIYLPGLDDHDPRVISEKASKIRMANGSVFKYAERVYEDGIIKKEYLLDD